MGLPSQQLPPLPKPGADGRMSREDVLLWIAECKRRHCGEEAMLIRLTAAGLDMDTAHDLMTSPALERVRRAADDMVLDDVEKRMIARARRKTPAWPLAAGSFLLLGGLATWYLTDLTTTRAGKGVVILPYGMIILGIGALLIAATRWKGFDRR